MTAGVISPAVRMGSLEGASCSMVAKRDCEGILHLGGIYAVSEEIELDTDVFGDEAAMVLSGGGKFGVEGRDGGAGDRGEEGGEFERLFDVSEGCDDAVWDTVCAVFPLLRVGSEEVVEGFRRDSLSCFKMIICSYMRPNNGRTEGAVSTQLRKGCFELSCTQVKCGGQRQVNGAHK